MLTLESKVNQQGPGSHGASGAMAHPTLGPIAPTQTCAHPTFQNTGDCHTTFPGAVVASNVLLNHLRKLRDEDEFDHLYHQAEIDAASIGLKPLPSETDDTDIKCRRQVRPPSRYEMQTNTSRPHNFTEKEKLRILCSFGPSDFRS